MRRLVLEIENPISGRSGTTRRELGQGGGRFHEMGQSSLRICGLCWNAHGGGLLETQLVMKECG